jgi:Thiamine monophosphate synthase
VALEAGADGVHVGQDDLAPADVRELVGPHMLVGLSTHAPREIDAVDPVVVDYIGMRPIYQTPTKPGRPAVGLELVRHAAAHAPVPFFAIGGIGHRESRRRARRGRKPRVRPARDRRRRTAASSGRAAKDAEPVRDNREVDYHDLKGPAAQAPIVYQRLTLSSILRTSRHCGIVPEVLSRRLSRLGDVHPRGRTYQSLKRLLPGARHHKTSQGGDTS